MVKKKLTAVWIGLLMLGGCTSGTELYQGHFEGQPYRLQHIVRKLGFSETLSQTLTLKGLSGDVRIDDGHTSPGLPYTFDLYAGVLSEKVQMPGQRLRIAPGGPLTPDDLRAFRSSRDRPLELDFKLEVDAP